MTGLYDDDTVQHAVERVRVAAADGRLSRGGAENLLRWLQEPQYACYVPRLLELITAERYEELDGLFWEVIPFGTGGRRGTMHELGSATINERTIAESADGLARYLKEHKGAAGGRAVVAHDTRVRSPEFARLTATTLAAHGLTVFFFESHRSTPELSFAVRHLKCDVGAMISASHNPPSDNGFKAYWSSGAQVLPPHDKGIIECVYRSAEIPCVDFDQAVSDGRIQIVGPEIDRAYLDAVAELSLSSARGLKGLFSPLHGVGETSVYRVLQEAGFADIGMFEPHRVPDGNFPNVPDHLPNPERSQVFLPMLDEAERSGATVLMASDPDADRLGVAAKASNGEFVFFTGNQVGTLIVDYVLRKRAAVGSLSSDHYVVQTLVTTPLIATIAHAYGVRAIDDLLVGFKYIAETMDREGPDLFVFGAEESLGYLAGDYCRDKDAAVAALYVAELAAELQAEGRTLLDRLDDLYREHGYFYETQRSEVCTGPRGNEQIAALMSAFRASPPKKLGGLSLERVRDYHKHEIRALPENTKLEELPSPSGNLLFFEAADPSIRVSIAVRPSGTEPKIKFYYFARSDMRRSTWSLQKTKENTVAKVNDVADDLSEWIKRIIGGR